MSAFGAPAAPASSTEVAPVPASIRTHPRPRDLDSRAAIHDLVVRFYREIVFDELLEPVFSEVAEVDWSLHLPKLTDYWCRVLLGDPGYDGYILAAHRRVHDIEPLTIDMFDRWYCLWSETIDLGWSGPVAETAKRHASRIGSVLARQIIGLDWVPPLPADPVDQVGTTREQARPAPEGTRPACVEPPVGDP